MSFKASAILCLFVMLLTACTDESGCRISGVCSDDTYKQARLCTLDGRELGTSAIKGSDFSFLVEGDILEPYMGVIYLLNPSDSLDYVDIPVGVENGSVRIRFGKSFKISGTPLNDKIQVFLSGLSQLRDAVTSPDRTVSVDQIPAEFSHYYSKSIVLNYDNPLGEYILRSYGSHLLGDDKAQAEQSLKR